MPYEPSAAPAARAPARAHAGEGLWLRARAFVTRHPRVDLAGVMALAAALNLWDLSRNGWANEYYAAAVRSMSTSWHDFLYASLDKGGVMTVDKPPLALWVQALSVRVFGYHPLSILVPQALMGVATVALTYDLVRRRFGRLGGLAAGVALATTPITVAMSRHNNPDALLILCCVAALWCAVRGLEDGRTRWAVLTGLCVGLGFETKMGVALTVVPGIALAWLWMTPAGRGRVHALRQLLAGGATLLVVGGAWPALVELTPAADRPWVSGTADNRVLSLIFEYNGLGRVDGQAGGPGGAGGGNVFGGSPGPLRLLNSALGGQAGWLLGFAVVSALGLLALTRLRRDDRRSGWLLAVGGAFLTTAVLFSVASGIFHPYYVSLLAPFTAALAGAGVAQLVRGGSYARIVGALAIVAGVIVELAVRGDYAGQLTWLPALLIVVGAGAIVALLASASRAVCAAAVGVAFLALLAAPTVWAVDTLGHATAGTFPAGGPANVEEGGFGGGQFGARGLRGRGGFGGARGFPGAGASVPGAGGAGGSERAGGVQLFGPGSSSEAGTAGKTGTGGGAGTGGGGATGLPGGGGAAAGAAPGFGGAGGRVPGGFGGFGAGAGGGFGGGSGELTQALSYARAHGGGTVAVASQSTAATAIIDSDANVAGIGGFSGRESDVTVSWLAQEVRLGKIRWVLDEQSGGFGAPGDGRVGAKRALAAAAKACTAVSLTGSAGTSSTGGQTAGAGETTGGSVGGFGGSSATTLYDCAGRAAALERLAGGQ